jgi:hypothetical protein
MRLNGGAGIKKRATATRPCATALVARRRAVRPNGQVVKLSYSRERKK